MSALPTKKPEKRGGARPNSGPKPSGIERSPTTVYLSAEERATLKRLGGSKWLQEQLSIIDNQSGNKPTD